jgi:hypothetical protein
MLPLPWVISTTMRASSGVVSTAKSSTEYIQYPLAHDHIPGPLFELYTSYHSAMVSPLRFPRKSHLP